MTITDRMSMALLYHGLRLATQQHEMGEKFANNLYSYFSQGDNAAIIVGDILTEWQCFDSEGAFNLTNLSNPQLVRPCSRLHGIYANSNVSPPHEMFAHADATPDIFRRMVFTYRMGYDLMYLTKTPHQDPEDNILAEGKGLFLNDSALFTMDDELTPIIGG